MRVCPYVRRSVRRSIRMSVGDASVKIAMLLVVAIVVLVVVEHMFLFSEFTAVKPFHVVAEAYVFGSVNSQQPNHSLSLIMHQNLH